MADREVNPQEQAKMELSQKQFQAKYGMPGIQELAYLENARREAEKGATASPESQKRVEIAEKRMELFYAEHDAAGAFKFKKFGREVQSYFNAKEGEKPVIEQGEKGEFKLGEGQERRRMLFVNMGELDRFNKEGGSHDAGDKALAETSRIIEDIVRGKLTDKEGSEAHYSLFRYSGNEFAVNFPNVSDEDFQAIQEKINESRASIPGVEDPAPLTSVGVDLKESLDIINQLQLGEDEKVEAGPDGAREVVEVMKHLADFRLEKAKVASRAQRILEVIKSKKPEDAKVFFKTYMEKTFSGTELGDFDKFDKQIAQGDLFFEDVIYKVALESAEKRLFTAQKFENERDGIIRKRTEARRVGARTETIESPAEEGLAVVPERTKGQEILEEKKRAAEEAAATGDAEQSEMKQLDYQIEVARRDAGTGLLDRGSFYENAEKAIESGRESSVVFVDMGFLKYFDQKGGSEVGDAALKLASDIMEKAISQSGVKGDAFRYGGDEFTLRVDGGDAESQKVIDQIMLLKREAGRVPPGPKSKSEYGPTALEFNIGTCDKKLLEEVTNDLVSSGRLSPEALDGRDGINLKAELQTKIADVGLEATKAVSRFNRLLAEMEDPGYDAGGPRKAQVESMMKFSEKALFKGGDELLKRLHAERNGSQADIVRRAEELRSKLTAENRLSAQEIEKQVADQATEQTKDALRSVEQQIREFVAEQLDSAHDLKDEKRDLRDRMIEVHSKINFLQEEINKVKAANLEKDVRVKSLEAKLKSAQEDRKLLVEGRKKIDSAYESRP